MEFYLEGNIRSNKLGYESLAVCYHRIIYSKEKKVVLRFDKALSFDVNLAAVLGAIFHHLKVNGIECIAKGFDSETQKTLIRNGFHFSENKASIKSSEPYVCYQQFRLDSSDSFKKYVTDQLLNKDSFPKHSDGLKKEMVKNIFEIFENANHGDCSHVFTCGHHYPQYANNRSRLDFTIVDIGRTFFHNINKHRLRNNISQILSPYDSIDWAVQKGNTTKIETGGLGLGLLLEFLDLNKGRMQILSGKGFWEYDGEARAKNEEEKTIKSEFPGSIINIEFNLDDTNSYSLTSEKKEFSGIF